MVPTSISSKVSASSEPRLLLVARATVKHQPHCSKLRQEQMLPSRKPCQCLFLSEWAACLNEAQIAQDIKAGRAFLGQSSRHPEPTPVYRENWLPTVLLWDGLGADD